MKANDNMALDINPMLQHCLKLLAYLKMLFQLERFFSVEWVYEWWNERILEGGDRGIF
jgi:hypothetical protein